MGNGRSGGDGRGVRRGRRGHANRRRILAGLGGAGAAGLLLAGVAAGPLGLAAPAEAARAPSAVTAGSRAEASAAAGSNEGNFGATSAQQCSGLDTSLCMLPFPDDFYTQASKTSVTGRQVSIPAGTFPGAVGQGPLSPTPYDQNDGFSPGSTILLHVPGISLAASKVATDSDTGASLGASSPVVLIDATTGRRWPTWTELDVQDADPSTRLLMIHPATNLIEGHRYLVALRNLRTSTGSSIAAPLDFTRQVLKAKAPLDNDAFEPIDTNTNATIPAPFAVHLRAVVAQLGHDGVGTKGMYLAWDFTVISQHDLTAPAVTMRDLAFKTLGAKAPSFSITSLQNDPADKPSLARVVTGTLEVPSFLSGSPGQPGSVLTTGKNGLPVHLPGAIDDATFECEIPKDASPAHPATVGVYGHGLFGDETEVVASGVPQYSDVYDSVFCSTDWVGLSHESLLFAATVLQNLNDFPSLIDNLMQSLLNAEFLGRLLDDPRGFAASPAFQLNGRPLIKAGRGLVYYGNSLGGIMGGAFTAVDPDVQRSVLGVTGMDFDVLLSRSVDFSVYESYLNRFYPQRDVQELGFDVVQMLWDRGEGDGYAEQMVGHQLAGTQPHQVILEEAFGDHQVANVETAVEARTIGASVRQPALAAGRSNLADPFWGLPAFKAGSSGPALFVWDSGVPAPPATDVAPTAGHDPHDTVPRLARAFWKQMHIFFATGVIINPCGSAPCKAPYPSTPGNQ